MTLTNNFTRLLHTRLWEPRSFPKIANIAGAGVTTQKSRLSDQFVYLIRATTTADIYDTFGDAWGTLGSPSLATFGAGTCSEHMPMGPAGNATGGSSSTVATSLNIPIDLRGYKIRITAGPGAGDERTILSNTIGATSVITVDSNFSAAITSSSSFQLITGSWWLFGGGTLASGSFKVFDYATQTWTNKSITGLPASFGTDGCLVGTPSIVDNGVVTAFATGTATGGTVSTISNAGKNWATNQWANAFQVRITGGTGAGQVRRIASNTATDITVTSNWTTNPDSTSTYSIEGDDDSLYLLGAGAVTMYRYSISGNSWSTISPTSARGAATSTGMSASWIATHPAADWTTENNIKNGRRIYSFRGGGSTALDYFDIPTQAWSSTIITYPMSITPTTGWKFLAIDGKIYIRETGTGLTANTVYVYDPATGIINGINSLPMLCSTSAVGSTMFQATLTAGGTTIKWLYVFIDHGVQSSLFRFQVV